jgi:hypothetical protein
MVLYTRKEEGKPQQTRKVKIMKTTRYEDMFAAIANAKVTTEKLDEVIEYLRANPRSSVADIRKAVYSDSADYLKQSNATHIAAMLRTLRNYNIVTVDTKQGEPIQIEVEEYGPFEDEGYPLQIEVTDAKGNKYIIDNPYYKTRQFRYGYRKIKKWITPVIRIYSLCA